MEITVYKDILAPDGFLYIDRYLDFFMRNLQTTVTEQNGETHIEGELACNDFLDKLNSNLLKSSDFGRWVGDDTLDELHKKLKEKGLELDPLNFFVLCQYILTYIREQYFVLLKPTIKDTLDELGDVTSITFTNKDGKEVTTTNRQFVKMVIGNMDVEADKADKEYEVFKIVRIDAYTDKSNLQSAFCYYVALFLKEYFKGYPRRANCCMVSTLEQELILYMLRFFHLSAEPLSGSRFRQLIMKYGKFRERVSASILPNIGEAPVQFIKYKDWKYGNIKLDMVEPLKVGDSVKF